MLVGLVSVGALLLYLETRQRSRVASYALGRRMGLSRATHLRSLLAELGLLLGLAYGAGLALGRVALGLVHGLLDVDPSRPPTPLLVLPVAALVGAAAVIAVVTVLAALYAQRAADRTAPPPSCGWADTAKDPARRAGAGSFASGSSGRRWRPPSPSPPPRPRGPRCRR